jgi:hypothetical protein
MFDSKISAYSLIEEIKDEADIAIPISDEVYISWLNALEQLLYSEIIKEQSLLCFDHPDSEAIDIESHNIRFEDIHAVFVNSTRQLIKSTLTSGCIFPNTYFKENNQLVVNCGDVVENIDVIYFIRPVLKTEENYADETVKLPVEFIDLARAKLRGEAYKVANEDNLAAKWINDYNVLLETFRVWLVGKQSTFGL